MSSTTRPVSIAEPLRAPPERAIPPRLAGQRSPGDRLAVLDGWRGISIISVLACHLLPLGPARWDLNRLAGPFGMAIFFTLSGFLITSNLLKTPDVRVFLIRRACRILPLAYLFMLAVLMVQGQDFRRYLAYLTFTVNYHQPDVAVRAMSPLWSLCVEVHFYLFAAMLVAVSGRPGLLILPVLALVVTGLRVAEGATLAIRTHLRVDEILAGASVALLHGWPRGQRVRDGIGRVHPLAWGILFAASCYPHPAVRPLNYLRPYLAGLMVASTLWGRPAGCSLLTGRFLKYFADTSYALYVVHSLALVGWFETDSRLERYLLKRPVGLLLTFVLAHLSTFHYERYWIEFGRRWSARVADGSTGLFRWITPAELLRRQVRPDKPQPFITQPRGSEKGEEVDKLRSS